MSLRGVAVQLRVFLVEVGVECLEMGCNLLDGSVDHDHLAGGYHFDLPLEFLNTVTFEWSFHSLVVGGWVSDMRYAIVVNKQRVEIFINGIIYIYQIEVNYIL